MQRLRSPFRLRPGPGAEHRKNKGRREQRNLPSESDQTAERSDNSTGTADESAPVDSRGTESAGFRSHERGREREAGPGTEGGSGVE